ncbi:hypothetical protein ACOALA_03935 [Alicyclobacillus acidoterrestris]|uniref:hypothetical protein n=1 Tax=Alicyclobacillus acidoterrestris TaxID=1450 RepID=UPI003F538F71
MTERITAALQSAAAIMEDIKRHEKSSRANESLQLKNTATKSITRSEGGAVDA